MSGALGQIPLQVQGIDPWKTSQEIAGVGHTQAETGLLGQQTQTAAIQNYLAALKVGAVAPYFGARPPQFPGGPTAGAPGVAAGAIGAAGGPMQGPGAPPPLPSAGGPYGSVYSPWGVPVPGIAGAFALASNDPNKAWGDLIKTRATTLQQLLAPVSSREEYNQALGRAYTSGWIAPDDYGNHFAKAGDPDSQWQGYRQQWLNSFADPDRYLESVTGLAKEGLQFGPGGQVGAAPGAIAGMAAKTAATTAAEHGAAFPFKGPEAQQTAAGTALGSGATVEIHIRHPDGSGEDRQVLPSQVPAILASNPGSVLAPGAMGMRGALGNAIFGQESGYGANPAASVAGAQGSMQMRPGTFAQYAKPGEKISDPGDNFTVGQRALDDLWQKSGGDPMRTAVGYFSGQGNISPPGSPNPWRTDAADANGVKTSDYVRQVMTRMLAPPAAGPGAGGVGVGITKLSPQGAAGLQTTENMVTADSADVDKSLAAMQDAQLAQSNLLNIRSLIPGITTGAGAPFRQAVANWISTYAPNGADTFTKALTGGTIDPTKTANTQEFVKQTLQQAGTAERAALGARGGYNAIILYQRAFPNIEMQPTAIRDMTNLMLVANQRDVDYAQGASAWLQQNRDAFRAPGSTGQYSSVNNFDTQFAGTNAPQVYVAGAAMLNDKPYGQVMKGMTPAQQTEALRVAWRADPGAILLGPDGRKHVNPALGQQ